MYDIDDDIFCKIIIVIVRVIIIITMYTCELSSTHFSPFIILLSIAVYSLERKKKTMRVKHVGDIQYFMKFRRRYIRNLYSIGEHSISIFTVSIDTLRRIYRTEIQILPRG